MAEKREYRGGGVNGKHVESGGGMGGKGGGSGEGGTEGGGRRSSCWLRAAP